MKAIKYKNVDDYIDSFTGETVERLLKIRKAIQQTAPQAIEKISYNMPAYELHGNLVYFGGFTKHVSIFPHPNAIGIFKKELKEYATSKGTIQFANDKRLPVTLIKKIVSFRVKENLAKAKAKKKK